MILEKRWVMLVSPDVSYWNGLDQVIEAAQTKVYKLLL